MLKVISIF